MNAQDFCYWLNGFTELTQGQTPSPAQWKSIREHLDLVFSKVTPPVDAPSAAPTPASPGVDLNELIRRTRQFHPQQDWWNPNGITVTC